MLLLFLWLQYYNNMLRTAVRFPCQMMHLFTDDSTTYCKKTYYSRALYLTNFAGYTKLQN